jgi:hypothetical protein
MELHERVEPGAWYVTTDLFKRGGKKLAGPFHTRRGAADAREAMEDPKIRNTWNYWVDQAPMTVVTFRGSNAET